MDRCSHFSNDEAEPHGSLARSGELEIMTADHDSFGKSEDLSPTSDVDCSAERESIGQSSEVASIDAKTRSSCGDGEAMVLNDESKSLRSTTWAEFESVGDPEPRKLPSYACKLSRECETSKETHFPSPSVEKNRQQTANSNPSSKNRDCCCKWEKKRLVTESKKRRPTKASAFGSVRTFVVCLSVLQLMQVMGSGYSKSALTSIERRYRLSTFSVGLLQSCFHIGNLSVILFVSYFGSKWNRPRAIAIGSLLMAVSSFVSAMPQFIGSRYKVSEVGGLTSQSAVSASVYTSGALITILNNTQQPLSLENPGAFPINVTINTTPEVNIATSDTILNPISLIPLKNSKIKLCNNAVEGVTATPAGIRGKNSRAEDEIYPDEVLLLDTASLKDPAKGIPGQRGGRGELNPGQDGTKAAEEEYWDDSSFYIFIAIGSVLKGMGHSPLHPLGMSFVDDFATPRNSAVYIGIVSALSLLGPAFGFILGSLTTGTWVDWGWVDVSKVGIDPHHPLWVGAWWMGYVVTACLLLMATVPFCMFPRVIPKEEDNPSSEGACLMCFRKCCTDSNTSVDDESKEDQSCRESVKRDADDDDNKSLGDNENRCNACKVAIHLEDETLSKAAFQPLGDRLKAYEVMLIVGSPVKDADLLSPHETRLTDAPDIGNSCDISKPTQLISYLERPKGNFGNEEVLSVATTECRKLIPFSLSEIRFPSTRSHSVVSRVGNLTKSASVPAVNRLLSGHKSEWFDAKRRWLRNLSAKSVFTSSRRTSKPCQSRRASRLEKLALIDFTASLKGLLTDVVFLSTTCAFVCLTSFLAASVTYVSKYMESQFSVTASLANLLNGSVNLPMAVVGNLLGGWVIRRFNLNVPRTMAVAVIGLALTIICVATLLFFKCDEGVHADYSNTNARDSCSTACKCGDAYAPVCDVTTNITYRSACHAGCVDVSLWRKTQVYTGCRCLIRPDYFNITKPDTYVSTNDKSATTGILFRGPCERPDCSKSHLPVFLGVMGTASLTAGLASTPSTLVILRIVPPAEKAFAIGIVFVFTRVLAWIPAPVYVGYVIDSACLRRSIIGAQQYIDGVLSKPGSGDRRHCEIYDKNRLRRNFFAATGALLVLSLVFYVVALYLEIQRSRRRKRVEDERVLSYIESPMSPDCSSDPVTGQVVCNLVSSYAAEDVCKELLSHGSAEEEGLEVDNGIKTTHLHAAMELLTFEMNNDDHSTVSKSVSAPALVSRFCDSRLVVAVSPDQDQRQVIHATAV